MYDKQKVRGSLEFSLPLLISHSTQLLILCSLLSITILLCIPKQVAAYTITPIRTSTHTITPAHIVHFLGYENSTYGIKMEYPSNWQIRGTNEAESHDNDKGIVEFRSSTSTSNPSVDRSTLSISIHKLPSQNIIVNLLGFFDKSAPKKIALQAFVLSHMTTLLTKLPNFHVIRSDSGESTLADNTPAHKIVYEYREQGQKNILTKGMDILVAKDDTGYVIRYTAEEPKYLVYLPIVQQMVNSVELTR